MFSFIARLFCIFPLAYALFLTACTTDPVPRAGVLEAKACLKSRDKDLGELSSDFKNLLINYCTNNGAWVVTRLDPHTYQRIEQFDFVNNEYAGPETGFVSVEVDSLGEDKALAFYNLQKKINSALKNEM